MAPRVSPPFRADHVGSLLRPPELTRARQDHWVGRVTPGQLREAEDRAIREAVRLQEEAGLQSVTDGEYRRTEWHTDFIKRIGGIREGESVVRVPVHGGTSGDLFYDAHPFEVTGKVHLTETIFGDDFAFLASATSTATPKQTIPSPSMAHFRADLSGSGYADPDQYRADLAAVYADEIDRLAGLGCRYLQLDDTMFAFLNDPGFRENLPPGANPAHQHEINLRVINQALAGRPEGLTVTVHMCRGNYRSAWFTTGGYDFVAESVFGGLQADAFFLEYDDERSGGFEPLRFVPEPKLVVLGLVTTKTAELESKDELKRRVDEAARFLPLERLCLSPQCGFASVAEGNALTIDQQRAKLDLVAQTAAEIWG